MALTVQDPTNPVGNANSYISLVDARALATMYAIELPVDDTEAETALIKGFGYIESYEPRMCGTRSTTEQNTAYPRTGVYVNCQYVASDSLPNELLLSQVIAAEQFGQGVNIWGGADDGKSISREKVDVIEVAYYDNGKTGSSVTVPRLESTIKPLLCGNTGGVNFTTVRV